MAIQIRRGTDAEWESNKSNIVAGEPAIAMDTERVFVGTGTGTYVELANIDFVEKAMKEVEYSNFELQSVSGGIVSFPNGAGGIPVKDLQVSIEAVQSGSGDPSPTNVRPISGWTGAEVNVTGKNLLASASLKNGVYISNTTGNEVSYGTWSASGYIPMQINTRYRLLRLNNGEYTPVVGANLYWAAYDKNFNYVTGGSGDGITASNPNIKYMRVSSSTAYLTKGVLVVNDDMSDFATEADYIDGNTYPISWQTEAGTVYGGTLDVTTGVLTITHKYVNYDENSFWSQNGSTVVSTSVPGDCRVSQVPLASHAQGYSPRSSVDIPANGCAFNANFLYFNFKFPSDMSVDDWKAILAVNNLQIVYELATPQTVQLTPTQVTTLLGQNNIWCNSGKIESLTYRISKVL